MRPIVLLLALATHLFLTTNGYAQIRPVKEILEKTSAKISAIEATHTQLIDKVKSDFVFKETGSVAVTVFGFQPGKKYRLCAFGESDKVKDINIKIFETTDTVAFAQRKWKYLKQDFSNTPEAELDFSIPANDDTPKWYKIEVSALFLLNQTYSHFGLLVSRKNESCWLAGEDDDCSVYSQFKEASDAALNLEQSNVEVIGFEINRFIKSGGSTVWFPRKFFTHNRYHIWAYGDRGQRVKNIGLALLTAPYYTNWYALADHQQWLGYQDSLQRDAEMMLNLEVPRDDWHEIITWGQFGEGEGEGLSTVLIGRSDKPAAPYPTKDDHKQMAELAGMKLMFGQVAAVEKSGENWHDRASAAQKGYFQFCKNLSVVQHLDDNSLGKPMDYEVMSRWVDDKGNFHFVLHRRDQIAGANVKLFVSKQKDEALLFYLDEPDIYQKYSIEQKRPAKDGLWCLLEEQSPVGCKVCTRDTLHESLRGLNTTFTRHSKEVERSGTKLPTEKVVATGTVSISQNGQTLQIQSPFGSCTLEVTERRYIPSNIYCGDIYWLNVRNTVTNSTGVVILDRGFARMAYTEYRDGETVIFMHKTLDE